MRGWLCSLLHLSSDLRTEASAKVEALSSVEGA